MKTFKLHLPIILFALFEIAVGVLLLINASELMKWTIIVFGAALIIVGVVNLIRYFTVKEGEKRSAFMLVGAALALIIGVLCVSLFNLIVNFIIGSVIVGAVIFGVIIFIAGVYKLQVYLEAKRAGQRGSFFAILNIILSIVFGAVIILLSITQTAFMTNAIWTIVAIALFVDALMDLLTVVHALILEGRIKKLQKEAQAIEKEQAKAAAKTAKAEKSEKETKVKEAARSEKEK